MAATAPTWPNNPAADQTRAMSDNPYTPPDAKLADPADPADQSAGSPVKAVLLGALVDVGGSLLLSTVMGIVLAVVLAQQGMAPEQIGEAFGSMTATSPFRIIAMVLGTGMSMLAGYVCARIARRRDYKLPCILGAISVTAGFLFAGDPDAVGMSVLNSVLTFGAVIVGARLGMPKAAPAGSA